MNTEQFNPWKPTCWVGGWLLPIYDDNDPWIIGRHKQLECMRDDRRKYAATKANAAILRAARKN